MTLDADSIVDRRRLRRKLSFWRAAAFLALAVVIVVATVPALRRAAPGSDQIARYTIDGLITDDREERDTLDRIARADRVKALILYIDSPGGTTTGAEALYGAIRRVAEKKPVVAVVGTMAASGAYVAALGADQIVAHGNSLVGSIGVLLQWPEFSDLLKRIGVHVHEVKSTPLKAAPNPFEPPSPEARAVIESLIRDSYDWFVNLVRERRQLDPQSVPTAANGQVFTGRQALALKLVDRLGDERDAVRWLAEAKGIKADLPVRRWRKSRSRWDELSFAERSLAAAFQAAGLDRLAAFVERRAPGALMLDGLLSVWHPPAPER
jgi:protease-4